MRWNGRKTGLAGLLALVLLLGSLLSTAMAAGSPVYADEPAAVYYGYVVPEQGGVMPKRIRAFSQQGVVCGSADVTGAGSLIVGFYAIAVVSHGVKEGCPTAGEPVRFAFVYGLIDEGIVIGSPTPFRPGEATSVHLIRTAADTAALP